jgi:hypothetical protein
LRQGLFMVAQAGLLNNGIISVCHHA